MASGQRARIWLMRSTFALLALVVIFFQLLPLDTTPRKWAPPDVILGLALVWSLRRPDYVPTLLLALVMLAADLLFQRPPGLLALLAVLGCELLKARVLPHRETTFAAEWFEAALVIAAITALNRIILNMTGVPQAYLALTLIQMITTIAAYPILVALSQSVFGVRKLTPVEADALGNR